MISLIPRLAVEERQAYPNDDRKPELSLNEEVGSMTEERLDDGRVECVKEGTRGELPTIISSIGVREVQIAYSVPVNGPYLPKFSTKRKPVNH